MVSRRDFLKTVGGVVAGAVVAGCDSSSTNDSPLLTETAPSAGQPNILLVLVDEMRQPPIGYDANEGEAPGVKEILRFESELSPGNPFTELFPAFVRLRQNSVVLRNHYTASAACAPSRTTFMTGQYPSLHGVTQVNGTFKVPDEIKFLDPDGVPTVGDWFRAAGYETHYFGKWHVSNTSEPPYDLEPWGFSSYETSGPDPDSSVPGLGAYRDPGFADIVSDFFTRKGQEKGKPWFAVASFANPHDTGAYPVPFFLPGTAGVTAPLDGKNNPQGIPPAGTVSNTSADGVTVDLNPDNFPQETFELPRTYNEDLSSKPDCHLDSAWKMQMALAAAFPPAFQEEVHPFPTQALSPELQVGWAKAYGQFYVYLQHLVNIDLDQILKTFDAAGLAKDTIIVFTSDHGSNGMAHNQMVQKFFTAYEEAVKVPFVISSPRVNPQDTVVQMEQPTSHIDLAPTLLGLAGFSGAQIDELKNSIQGQSEVRDFVGLDLTPYLGGSVALPRPGILFTTSDDATRLADVPDPVNQDNFDYFIGRVQGFIDGGAPLFPGACVEPNAVHMLCTGDWKYSRYYDDIGDEPDQFEMYHLPTDRRERVNLVDFRTGELLPGAAVAGLGQTDLQAQLILLRSQLAEREAVLLLTPATS